MIHLSFPDFGEHSDGLFLPNLNFDYVRLGRQFQNRKVLPSLAPRLTSRAIRLRDQGRCFDRSSHNIALVGQTCHATPPKHFLSHSQELSPSSFLEIWLCQGSFAFGKDEELCLHSHLC